MKIIGYLILAIAIGMVFGLADGRTASFKPTPPKTTNVVLMDSDYCHPVHRHSKWWTCDGVSVARWLHDNPVAPKGVHPVAAR